MNGKDLEELNEIDEFIRDIERKHPEIKAKMSIDNDLVFSVDFKYGYSEQEQQEELNLIEKAYFKHFNKNLKNKILVRIGDTPNTQELDYFYSYKTK